MEEENSPKCDRVDFSTVINLNDSKEILFEARNRNRIMSTDLNDSKELLIEIKDKKRATSSITDLNDSKEIILKIKDQKKVTSTITNLKKSIDILKVRDNKSLTSSIDSYESKEVVLEFEDKKRETLTIFESEVKDKKKAKFSMSSIEMGEEEWDGVLETTDCKQYQKVEDFANFFIDQIIDESLDIIQKYKPNVTFNLKSQSSETLIVTWPTIDGFNVELGKSAIERYLMSWSNSEKWKYNIIFLSVLNHECRDIYKFEVTFSIPCKQYPVPQSTASVFFLIDVSRLKPKYCQVDVTYYFEGNRLIHSPGKYEFKEEWLFNIIESKLKFFKSLDF